MNDVAPARATRRQWRGLWVLAVALGMIVLDGTIVGVALPQIVQGLHLDLTDAQWVNSLYSVVFAALLLVMGRAGDRHGRRRLLLVGLVLFLAGSILAAGAGSVTALLVARAVQGVGGAMVLPATLSTVSATFRGPDRPAAFGIWGAVMSGAAAIGPLLGGWLTDVASWPWIFWVNVPVGLAVIVGTFTLVDETRSDEPDHGIDLLGTVLSAAGFGLTVFGIIEGSDLGWWTPKQPLHLLGLTWPTTAPVSAAPVAILLGLLLVAAFVLREARQRARGHVTVLDVGLFRLPSFALGNLTATLVAVGEFALVFVLPLFLVTALRLTMMQAGLVLAAMAVGAFLSGASARHLSARMGPTRVVVLGLALEVLGAAATALAVGAGASAWVVAACLVPYGLGLGLASAQLTSTTLRDVPPASSGAGSATQSTVRQLGSALGSALGGLMLSTFLGTSGRGGAFGADPATFAHAASAAVWAASAILLVALGLSVALDRAARRPAADARAA